MPMYKIYFVYEKIIHMCTTKYFIQYCLKLFILIIKYLQTATNFNDID